VRDLPASCLTAPGAGRRHEDGRLRRTQHAGEQSRGRGPLPRTTSDRAAAAPLARNVLIRAAMCKILYLKAAISQRARLSSSAKQMSFRPADEVGRRQGALEQSVVLLRLSTRQVLQPAPSLWRMRSSTRGVAGGGGAPKTAMGRRSFSRASRGAQMKAVWRKPWIVSERLSWAPGAGAPSARSPASPPASASGRSAWSPRRPRRPDASCRPPRSPSPARGVERGDGLAHLG